MKTVPAWAALGVVMTSWIRPAEDRIPNKNRQQQRGSPSLPHRELVRELQGFSTTRFSLMNQTNCRRLAAMLELQVRRLLDAYPAIFLACHRKHLREDEAGSAVTEHQASILDHLDGKRPTTLSHLAEHMGVGRSAMSITLARLIDGGYVRSRRDGHDRRRVALTLTPAGERVKEHNTVLDRDLAQALLRAMPAPEREIALQGIEKLAVYATVLLRRRKRKI
jgi:MarR family transcriptional regulator, organic hydroperoxide resistance regulator